MWQQKWTEKFDITDASARDALKLVQMHAQF